MLILIVIFPISKKKLLFSMNLRDFQYVKIFPSDCALILTQLKSDSALTKHFRISSMHDPLWWGDPSGPNSSSSGQAVVVHTRARNLLQNRAHAC